MLKKVIAMLLTSIMVLSGTVHAWAENSANWSDLDFVYENAYINSANIKTNSIENDYDAYALILEGSVASVEKEKVILKEVNIAEDDLLVLEDFISRLNVLIEKNAIEVSDSFEISVKKDKNEKELNPNRAAIVEILPEARYHASELREVYDNALFGEAHLTAGLYFTERVKSGGSWDYKSYLGTNTAYYEPELKAHITGETIGNFHYGYVGSEIFGPTTLKTAAGLVQISSGTSSSRFWSSYFDDPKDIEDIEWGISVYNREN